MFKHTLSTADASSRKLPEPPAAQAIVVEFYGLARLRAGRETLRLSAGTIAEALAVIEQTCPDLPRLLTADGRLDSHYLVSLGGQRFVDELNRPLEDGDRLLLLGADSGG